MATTPFNYNPNAATFHPDPSRYWDSLENEGGGEKANLDERFLDNEMDEVLAEIAKLHLPGNEEAASRCPVGTVSELDGAAVVADELEEPTAASTSSESTNTPPAAENERQELKKTTAIRLFTDLVNEAINEGDSLSLVIEQWKLSTPLIRSNHRANLRAVAGAADAISCALIGSFGTSSWNKLEGNLPLLFKMPQFAGYSLELAVSIIERTADYSWAFSEAEAALGKSYIPSKGGMQPYVCLRRNLARMKRKPEVRAIGTELLAQLTRQMECAYKIREWFGFYGHKYTNRMGWSMKGRIVQVAVSDTQFYTGLLRRWDNRYDPEVGKIALERLKNHTTWYGTWSKRTTDPLRKEIKWHRNKIG